MYKALLSFTTIKSYGDIKKDEILDSDFDTPEAIQEYLDIGYIEEYHGGGGSDLDWSAIGYNSRPQSIDKGYDYAKQIQETWTGSSFSGDDNLMFLPNLDLTGVTSFYSMFYNCRHLISIPLLDTSNVTNMGQAFQQATALTEIPLLDTSNVTNISSAFYSCTSLMNVPKLNTSSVTSFQNTFRDCPNLSDDSLKNILDMCIGATSYTGTKTLYYIGFRSGNYPATKIQGLSNYQAFIDAGWTIGY